MRAFGMRNTAGHLVRLMTPSVLVTFLIASHATGEDAFAKMDDLVRDNFQAGDVVWLAKSWTGDIIQVAAIFGYEDNLSACKELAGAINSVYPINEYVCVYADGRS